MKAFWEIGIVKSIKFAVYVFLEFFISLLFIPQLRVMVLRLFGAKIGKGTLIMNVNFLNLYRGSFRNLIIGDYSYIGGGVLLDLAGIIRLGDYVTIGERSMLITHMNVGFKDHPLQKKYPSKVSSLEIDSGSFVGVGAIILPGVKIGTQSLVAAGAVVTKNVHDRIVVAGIPGRVVKHLDSNNG